MLNRLPFPWRVFFGHFVMIHATCTENLTSRPAFVTLSPEKRFRLPTLRANTLEGQMR
jgi:hypothetical protein